MFNRWTNISFRISSPGFLHRLNKVYYIYFHGQIKLFFRNFEPFFKCFSVNSIRKFWFSWLMDVFSFGQSSKQVILFTHRTVSWLTLLCKCFSFLQPISWHLIINNYYGLFLICLIIHLSSHAVSRFLAFFLTLLVKPIFLFTPLDNMLNSKISNVFLRDFMLLKLLIINWRSFNVMWAPTAVKAVSFTKSDWRLIVYCMLVESHCWCNLYKETFFYHGATTPSAPRPPHYRGFTITLRHSAVGRTPLDEWSARSRDLYLTTHTTHNKHTSMPLVTKRNEDILEELKVEPVNEKLQRYKWKLLWHVTRMNSSRMPKIMLNYRPNSRRRLGRPWKSLWDEAETGLLISNWWRTLIMISHSRKMM
jgi:hypothetical protein